MTGNLLAIRLVGNSDGVDLSRLVNQNGEVYRHWRELLNRLANEKFQATIAAIEKKREGISALKDITTCGVAVCASDHCREDWTGIEKS